MTQAAPTFVLSVELGPKVTVSGKLMERQAFYAWLWESFAPDGLLGVHEGTLLSTEAAEQGLETESWTVDSGEAPRERDWVGKQNRSRAELYFETAEGAERARARILELVAKTAIDVSAVTQQEARDWDAEWKASFLAQPEGLRIPPNWHIAPPWVTDEEAKLRAGDTLLRINPGAGFGTGTHETTQLCLGAIGECGDLRGLEALDFGSGSGILAIGLALRGAKVRAVEIDPLAIDNAKDNAALNGVEPAIDFSRTLGAMHTYRLVVANILRPVLLEFADKLCERLSPGGPLILSGLIDRDVAEVRARYSALLKRAPEVRELGEWRCLFFK